MLCLRSPDASLELPRGRVHGKLKLYPEFSNVSIHCYASYSLISDANRTTSCGLCKPEAAGGLLTANSEYLGEARHLGHESYASPIPNDSQEPTLEAFHGGLSGLRPPSVVVIRFPSRMYAAHGLAVGCSADGGTR